MATGAERVIDELRAGRPVLLPTDTVYGLSRRPASDEVERLYALKGRRPEQPTALLAATIEQLLVVRARARASTQLVLETLLPGPFTLVCRTRRAPIPLAGGLPTATRSASACRVCRPRRAACSTAVGCVAATSANDPGGPDPRTLDDVPARLRAACAALDAGPLPGTPSTVLDFTGPEPRVLREGASPSAEAIARVRRARVRSG